MRRRTQPVCPIKILDKMLITCLLSLENLKARLGDVDGVPDEDSGTASGCDEADVTIGVVGVDAVLLWSSGDKGSEEQLDNRVRFLFTPSAPVRLLFIVRFIPLTFLMLVASLLLNGASCWLTGLTCSCLLSFCVCCLRFSFFSIFSICLRYTSSFLCSRVFLAACFSGLFSMSESLSPCKKKIALPS